MNRSIQEFSAICIYNVDPQADLSTRWAHVIMLVLSCSGSAETSILHCTIYYRQRTLFITSHVLTAKLLTSAEVE